MRSQPALAEQRSHLHVSPVSSACELVGSARLCDLQMLGWEEPLLKAVADVRKQEMHYCGRMNRIRASNMALQFISVPLFAFITFTTVS